MVLVAVLSFLWGYERFGLKISQVISIQPGHWLELCHPFQAMSFAVKRGSDTWELGSNVLHAQRDVSGGLMSGHLVRVPILQFRTFPWHKLISEGASDGVQYFWFNTSWSRGATTHPALQRASCMSFFCHMYWTAAESMTTKYFVLD